MDSRFTRTELMFGEKAKKLTDKNIIVFGVGGVGGFVCEGLARSGIGHMTIVDKDDVDITNINRQIIALSSTIGQSKVEVMSKRLVDINPNIDIDARQIFYLPDTADQFDLSQYDYVVDAVDNVTAKLNIIERAKAVNVPVISCMGAGNKLDPTLFRIDDIEKTSVCPLAKVMRRELKKRGIKGVKVLYSTEKPVNEGIDTIPSVAFVPSVAGMIIAGEVIKDLMNYGRDQIK